MLMAFSTNNWITGPRFLYFVVVTTVTLSGDHIRPSRLYVCLPLLFVMAQNGMGVTFLLLKAVQETIAAIRRFSVSLLLVKSHFNY